MFPPLVTDIVALGQDPETGFPPPPPPEPLSEFDHDNVAELAVATDLLQDESEYIVTFKYFLVPFVEDDKESLST